MSKITKFNENLNIAGIIQQNGNTATTGTYSTAFGTGTTAIGMYSHAEGSGTIAGNAMITPATFISSAITISTTTGEAPGSNILLIDSLGNLSSTWFPYLLTYGTNLGGASGTTLFVSLTGGPDPDEVYPFNTIFYSGIENQTILYFSTPANTTPLFLPIFTGHTTLSFLITPSATTIYGDYSHAEGSNTVTSGNSSHAEGQNTTAIGIGSHTEGNQTTAIGDYSHSEGNTTTANGVAAHAEGNQTTATGNYSHAEGNSTIALNGSHAEGGATTAYNGSHAEGDNTSALGGSAHAEGSSTKALGPISHAEGAWTTANEQVSHAEGAYSTALGEGSHAEGGSFSLSISGGTAIGMSSHAEGQNTTAFGTASHAEGINTFANGDRSHAEGNSTKALGQWTHAEGQLTTAFGNESHAEGYLTTAIGDASHAEGSLTIALGVGSHAEGAQTTSMGGEGHAEGWNTVAFDTNSHAEGQNTTAGKYSHAEGSFTTALGKYGHTEGSGTTALGNVSHAEGWNTKAGVDAVVLTGSIIATGITIFNVSVGNNIFDNILTLHSFDGTHDNDYNILSNWTTWVNNQLLYGSLSLITVTLTGGPDPDEIFYINEAIEFAEIRLFNNNLNSGPIYTGHTAMTFTVITGVTTSATTGVHAEGYNTTAIGDASHAEGSGSIAFGIASHAEGFNTSAGTMTFIPSGTTTISTGVVVRTDYPNPPFNGNNVVFLLPSSGDFSTIWADYITTYGTGNTLDVLLSGGPDPDEIYSIGIVGFGGGAWGTYVVNSSLIYTTFTGHTTMSFSYDFPAHFEVTGNKSHAGGYNSIASGDTSFIHSTNSLVSGNRSVVLGGQNLTGATDDTVYVPHLNIKNLTSGTSIANLGIAANGDVVTGTTGGGGGSVNKYTLTTGFTANVTITIPHNLSTSFINVALWDNNIGSLTYGTIDNRTTNTVDITLTTTLASVDIVIIG